MSRTRYKKLKKEFLTKYPDGSRVDFRHFKKYYVQTCKELGWNR